MVARRGQVNLISQHRVNQFILLAGGASSVLLVIRGLATGYGNHSETIGYLPEERNRYSIYVIEKNDE